MRLSLLSLSFALALSPGAVSTLAAAGPALPDASARGLKICVAADASAPIRAAAAEVLAAVGANPLLGALAGTRAPSSLTDSAALMAGPAPARAYDHLVLVGLPSDPLIQAAWQRNALVGEKGIYVFGFGNLQGDIGYVESDRNPFLHSAQIAKAPYETEIVTLTGTTPTGVAQAVAAFLKQGLLNGVVAAPGWTRGAPTLLDRDPLPPDFAPPAAPSRVGDAVRVGVTQPDESEYRGAWEAAGARPSLMWRYKYFLPGLWDGAGAGFSAAEFLSGLHRTACDESLWMGCFESEAAAAKAAKVLAKGWPAAGDGWAVGGARLPQHSNSPWPFARQVVLWQKKEWIYISTLPGLDSGTL